MAGGDLLPPALRLPVRVAGVKQTAGVAALIKTPDHGAQSLVVSRHRHLSSDLPTELDGFLKGKLSVKRREEAGLVSGVTSLADVDGGDLEQ